MKTSDSITKIAPAFTKAQAAFQTALKDRFNDFFRARYASAAAIWDSVRVGLSANGLGLIQNPEHIEAKVSADGVIMEREKVVVYTRLIHESGEWIEINPLSVPVLPDKHGKITAQSVGSAITYACRYAMRAMLGIPDAEDDDGNDASLQGESGSTTSPVAKALPAPKEQSKTLRSCLARIEEVNDLTRLDVAKAGASAFQDANERDQYLKAIEARRLYLTQKPAIPAQAEPTSTPPAEKKEQASTPSTAATPQYSPALTKGLAKIASVQAHEMDRLHIATSQAHVYQDPEKQVYLAAIDERRCELILQQISEADSIEKLQAVEANAEKLLPKEQLKKVFAAIEIRFMDLIPQQQPA